MYQAPFTPNDPAPPRPSAWHDENLRRDLVDVLATVDVLLVLFGLTLLGTLAYLLFG